MKTCSKCFVVKPPSEFNRHRKYADGLNASCKVCHRAATKAWATKNPERAKESLRKAYLSAREKRIAKAAEWYQKNRGRALALRREIGRQWKRRHPERGAINVAKRNAAKVMAVPLWADSKKISEIYREAKRLRDGSGFDCHVDHIVPLR